MLYLKGKKDLLAEAGFHRDPLKRLYLKGKKDLLAEAGFHRDPLTPLGAAAGKHSLAALGLHARAKAMRLRSLAPVRLECTLGHER